MNKNSVPYIIVDDFLENPDIVKNWALSLNYNPSPLDRDWETIFIHLF